MDLIINENKEYIIPSGDINILVKENINASLIEKNDSNRSIKIELENNSNIKYVSIDLSTSSNKEIKLKKNNNLEMVLANFNGGDKSLKVYLDDEESSLDIKSIIMMKDDSDKELIEVYHNAKNTQSKIENYITSNKAKVDVDVIGKIKKGMSNSNCVQKSRGIILSNDAKIKVMPVLLIDEFDVSANHGAAIGKLNDEDLYYLMSRGISKKDAEMLIVKGFLSPILSSLSNEELKDEILKLQDMKV
jgi:Fe-S cluster assembly protein SufD